MTTKEILRKLRALTWVTVLFTVASMLEVWLIVKVVLFVLAYDFIRENVPSEKPTTSAEGEQGKQDPFSPDLPEPKTQPMTMKQAMQLRCYLDDLNAPSTVSGSGKAVSITFNGQTYTDKVSAWKALAALKKSVMEAA